MFYCYNILTQPVKWNSVTSKWTWIHCKHILEILGQPLKRLKKKKRSITDVLSKERKWNHKKCSIKTQKAVRKVEDKNSNKRTRTTNVNRKHSNECSIH